MLSFRYVYIFFFVSFVLISPPAFSEDYYCAKGPKFKTGSEGWDGPGLGSAALSYYFANSPSGLEASAVAGTMKRAMAEWATYVDVQFRLAGNNSGATSFHIVWTRGEHGDSQPFDGKGGLSAHTLAQPDRNGVLYEGYIHFDDEEKWTLQGSWDGLNFYTVALHEVGHLLGLDHSEDPNSIMYFRPSKSGLSEEDVLGVRSLYAATDAQFVPSAICCVSSKTELRGRQLVEYWLGDLLLLGLAAFVLWGSSKAF